MSASKKKRKSSVVRTRPRGAQLVKLKVGRYEEMSAMPAETFEHVRKLVALGGYTLTNLLEIGIEKMLDEEGLR